VQFLAHGIPDQLLANPGMKEISRHRTPLGPERPN
jgi:hypothetical protein